MKKPSSRTAVQPCDAGRDAISGDRVERIVLRAARPSQARVLSELAVRSKAYWGYPPDFLAACREELTFTGPQMEAPDWSFTVAEASRRAVGFYALRRESAPEIELEALFLEPAWIGQGVGRRLVEHALRRARRLGASALTVQSDPGAAGFYLTMGARAAGWRDSHSIAGRRLPMFAFDLAKAHD